MSEDLEPDAIRARSFSTSRRGFEREEVEAFLGEVAGHVAALQSQLATTHERLNQLGITDLPDLKQEFDTVGQDVREILQAARDAAEDMRDRSKSDAAKWRQEATVDAQGRTDEAQQQAEALRGDAWQTADAMLQQVSARAAEMKAAANEDVLFIRAEAEKEALRLTGDARRDAEEVVRAAQAEAERLGREARAEGESTTETARQAAELAQERVRALEQRREELMTELEEARGSLTELEEQIDGRRGELTHATTDPLETAVRVIAEDEDVGKPEIGDWLDEDASVRLVPPTVHFTPEPVDPDEFIAEVESLRSLSPPIVPLEPPRPDLELVTGGSESSAGGASLDFEITSGDAVVTADASATAELSIVKDAESEQPRAPRPESTADVEPVSGESEPAPESEPAAEPERVAEELASEPEGGIDDLFASLRTPRPDPVPEPAVALPEPVAKPPSATEPAAAARVDTVNRPSGPDAVGTDPWDLRDRLLVPITNDVLRSIKREIVDLQNAVLEELRTESDDWRPKKAMFATIVGADAAGLADLAYAAGVIGSGELAAEAPPVIPEQSSHDLSSLITDLWEAVVDAIDSATGGARERGASVGRIFRAWRTDEAERRVRQVAHAEYNAGMAAGLTKLGLAHSVEPQGRDIADPDTAVIPGHRI